MWVDQTVGQRVEQTVVPWDLQ
jgi:hypothetical protein